MTVTHPVFVYGTLMQGQDNHHLIAKGFNPEDPAGSLYRRRLIVTQKGLSCWVYEWNRILEGMTHIDSGDWCEYILHGEEYE